MRPEDLTLYERASYYPDVYEILKELLKKATTKESVRFLRGLIRFKTYYYRAEAEEFRKLIGELIEKRLSNIQSGLSPKLSDEEVLILKKLG